MDMLRTPMPVVSDLSELGGGDEISLLSLLDTLGGGDARARARPTASSRYASTSADLIARHRRLGARGRRHADREPRRHRRAAHHRPVRGRDRLVVHRRPSRQTTATAPPGGASTRPRRATAPCPDGRRRRRPNARASATRRPTERRNGTRRVKESVTQKTKSRHRLGARLLAAVPGRPRPAHRRADRRGRGVVLPARLRQPGRQVRLHPDASGRSWPGRCRSSRSSAARSRSRAGWPMGFDSYAADPRRRGPVAPRRRRRADRGVRATSTAAT